MQVILKTDIPSLGKAGEIKDVSVGYARNYLLPQGLVFPATKTSMHHFMEIKKRQDRLRQRVKNKLEQVAKKIEKVSCTITVKGGEGERIFGAVTKQDIADSLRVKGINVDKRNILLADEIHHTGAYIVEIRLSPEVTAKLKVWVMAEDNLNSPTEPVESPIS